MLVREREFRAMTTLHNGQDCFCWLPAGEYKVLGECIVKTRQGEIEAVKLQRIKPEEIWYVSFANTPNTNDE